MQLNVDTDAAFSVFPKAQSRVAGYFRLLNDKNNINQFVDNGPIWILCKTLRTVVSLAAEAETYCVFFNAKKVLVIIYLLNQMGHLQTNPTPIRTDNSISMGFKNKNIQMKQSKTWDMQLHWLRDKENQKVFNFFG